MKGSNFPKTSQIAIQSCKCADPISAVAYFGETSALILKFYLKKLCFRAYKERPCIWQSWAGWCWGAAEAGCSIRGSEPRGSKMGRGSDLAYQGRSRDSHQVQPRVQIIRQEHGDEVGMRPSRTSSQWSGRGSVRNIASHRHSRSLAQQVGNGLNVNVAPKRRERAAVEASCHFLRLLQS